MILFAGDPHGNFKPIIRATRELRPDGVILLGDHDLDRPLEAVLEGIDQLTEVYWIPGNHDGDRDDWYDHLFGSALADRNLNGRVVTVGGLRVAGLGGVFRDQIWHPDVGQPRFCAREDFVRQMGKGNRWGDGLPRKHRVSIWWEDYARLADQRADILVTHEAPSVHKYGFPAIDELAQHMNASLIVHGHHHSDYTDELASGIRVLGVGLAGVTSDESEVISHGNQRRRLKF